VQVALACLNVHVTTNRQSQPVLLVVLCCVVLCCAVLCCAVLCCAVLCHQSDGGDPSKPKPKAPTSCGDNKEKHDCLDLGAEEGDCAWCKGDFMPASCVGVKAAEWIPEQVAKCKMPKKHKKDDAVKVGMQLAYCCRGSGSRAWIKGWPPQLAKTAAALLLGLLVAFRDGQATVQLWLWVVIMVQ